MGGGAALSPVAPGDMTILAASGPRTRAGRKPPEIIRHMPLDHSSFRTTVRRTQINQRKSPCLHTRSHIRPFSCTWDDTRLTTNRWYAEQLQKNFIKAQKRLNLANFPKILIKMDPDERKRSVVSNRNQILHCSAGLRQSLIIGNRLQVAAFSVWSAIGYLHDVGDARGEVGRAGCEVEVPHAMEPLVKTQFGNPAPLIIKAMAPRP